MDAAHYRARAMDHAEKGEWLQAAQCFRRALALDPQQTELNIRIINCEYAAHKQIPPDTWRP